MYAILKSVIMNTHRVRLRKPVLLNNCGLVNIYCKIHVKCTANVFKPCCINYQGSLLHYSPTLGIDIQTITKIKIK